jgi:hypothetical protein
LYKLLTPPPEPGPVRGGLVIPLGVGFVIPFGVFAYAFFNEANSREVGLLMFFIVDDDDFVFIVDEFEGDPYESALLRGCFLSAITCTP